VLALLLGAPAAAQAAGPAAVITGGPSATEATDSATFTFVASAPDGFASFQCSLDGAPWHGCRSPSAYAGLLGGAHTFAVRLVGLFADSTPAVRAWTVALNTQALPCGAGPSCVDPVVPTGVVPPVVSKVVRRSVRRDAGGCPYAGNMVGEVSDARLARATICLLDRERARHGLPAVRRNDALARAASSHARDMVRRSYFGHYTPGGSGPADRIQRTGYLAHAGYWAIGEVIAWTERPAPTPQAAVRAWLHSPPHRSVILTAAYRDVGAGVARGAPRRGLPRAGTFVADFGRRH
jgi:uncharacterized protein YkwD